MPDYKTLTDQQLTSFLQGSDQRAFTEIYRRYNLLLLQHAYNKLRNREDARDMVQETFAMLWQKRETIEPGSNLPGYLYTAVRNLILNHFSRQQVQGKYEQSMQQFAIEGTVTADHRIREKQLEEAIEREIAALPNKMRQVFELSRKEHLNHREIAEALHISERTVASHITHALRILKTRLGIFVLITSGFL